MIISLEITITKADRTLILTQVSDEQRTNLMVADIVSGCEDTGTPTGNYTVGKWIKNKTNPTHGPTPGQKIREKIHMARISCLYTMRKPVHIQPTEFMEQEAR